MPRRGGSRGREPVATREGQGQWFLGVQMLACSHRLAANRFMQVARNRGHDRIDVGTLEEPARVVEGLGPMAAGFLDDPLAAHPVLGLGIADGDDRRARQLKQGTQQSRTARADADQPQADRRRA